MPILKIKKSEKAANKLRTKSMQFFEEHNLMNIYEKYPEQSERLGNLLGSDTFKITTLNTASIMKYLEIDQNFILMRQNEEIIELLKEIKDK